jgi:DNA modification methylase
MSDSIMQKVVIGDATLYLADCMDVLPTLGRFDACITDPPYGINAAARDRKNEKSNHYFKIYEASDWDKERPSSELFACLIGISEHQIIFGGNYFSDFLSPSMGWLVWDKTQRGMSQADGEMAWTSFNNAMRIFSANRVVFEQEGGRDHPTQKPISLMKWCIEYADRHGKAQTILDPFAGSGTTGVAALQMGRKFVGIEREPAYFEIMCKRIQAVVDAPPLFPYAYDKAGKGIANLQGDLLSLPNQKIEMA